MPVFADAESKVDRTTCPDFCNSDQAEIPRRDSVSRANSRSICSISSRGRAVHSSMSLILRMLQGLRPQW